MYQQNKRRSVYQEITDKIVKAVEDNPGTLEMPRHRHGARTGLPRNAQTGRSYSGVNVLVLWSEGEREMATDRYCGPHTDSGGP